MQLLDIKGNPINLDVSQSRYPIKNKSRSKLQGLVADLLVEKYPRQTILEDFIIPRSKMSVDFFLPRLGIVYEVDGNQHYEYNSHYHGDRQTNFGFANQVRRDNAKENWCIYNDFEIYRITSATQARELLDG